MTAVPEPASTVAPERSGLADYAEETIGFGATEFRTARDLLLCPRTVLDAYLAYGPTGGRRYARPFGFYVALCGILMFYMFLLGGMKGMIEQQPAETLNGWIARSGKSREGFIGDADGWMSLVAVPILSLFYAAAAAPLIKWWSRLDWRRSIRATFALMCAWTVPIVPLGPLPMIKGFEIIGNLAMWGALIVAFLRMGRGLWWQSWAGGIGKSLLLAGAMLLGAFVGMIPVFNIGLLGALLGR
ncbi:hypothetical protein GCM10022281_21130 [Sphingomonas rosea]|uniref:Yip1 domain-containing protein n=1 Tax=Sphingomonas rosea TaxID=335605 RepID=A0ABP7UC61_9SPHN